MRYHLWWISMYISCMEWPADHSNNRRSTDVGKSVAIQRMNARRARLFVCELCGLFSGCVVGESVKLSGQDAEGVKNLRDTWPARRRRINCRGGPPLQGGCGKRHLTGCSHISAILQEMCSITGISQFGVKQANGGSVVC